MMCNNSRCPLALLALLCALVLLGLLLPGPHVQAANLDRPVDSSVAAPRPLSDEGDEGGWIELYVLMGGWQDPWTLVQWKDAQGGWNDIDGWRGQFDAIQNGVGSKTWEVDPANFGMGPVRWIVYEKASGAIVAQSVEFSLPTEIGQTVTLEVAP
jgi:hypothetical protein